MFILLCIPVLASLYAIPLVFGWVGPNPAYGFRNQRTLGNPQLWYQANRIAGMYIMVAMVVCVAVEFAIPALHRGPASHIAAPLVQISGLIIANAITTFRILRIVATKNRVR